VNGVGEWGEWGASRPYEERKKKAAKPTPAPFSGRPKALPAERCWGMEKSQAARSIKLFCLRRCVGPQWTKTKNHILADNLNAHWWRVTP